MAQIKLVSEDEQRFIIREHVAKGSPLVKSSFKGAASAIAVRPSSTIYLSNGQADSVGIFL